MNNTPSMPAATEAAQVGSAGRRRRLRLRWAVLAGAVVLAVAAVVAVAPFATTVPAKGVVDGVGSTSTLAVSRQDLSSQTQEPATLGYADSYSVVDQAQGTVTPAYRALSEDMTGADVEELNTDLVALGYVSGAELSAPSDEFTYWTKVAVQKLQRRSGWHRTGRSPWARRCSSLPRSGSRRCRPPWAPRPSRASRCSPPPRPDAR
jgi:hypothetical protein